MRLKTYDNDVPVQKRCSAGRNLFLTKVLVEEHGGIRNGPREIDVLPQTFRRRHTVLERPFVEHIGREFRKTWVHTVLNLETNWAVAEDDETLEERLCETCTGSFLIHNDRSELLEEASVSEPQHYG